MDAGRQAGCLPGGEVMELEGSGRLAAGVLIMAGCTLLGRGMARGQRRRVEWLEDGMRGLKTLERLMCDQRAGVGQALSESGWPPFQLAARAMEEDLASPQEAWRAVGEKEAGDGKAFDRLFSRLGRGDLAAQRETLEECRVELLERLAAEKKRRDETARLYPALGALTGLAVAVLLY